MYYIKPSVTYIMSHLKSIDSWCFSGPRHPELETDLRLANLKLFHRLCVVRLRARTTRIRKLGTRFPLFHEFGTLFYLRHISTQPYLCWESYPVCSTGLPHIWIQYKNICGQNVQISNVLSSYWLCSFILQSLS